MIGALQWLAVLWGLIYVVTDSALFGIVRVPVALRVGPLWALLLYCPSCFGFWASLAIQPLGLSLGTWPKGALGFAFAGLSGVAAGCLFKALFGKEQLDEMRRLPWIAQQLAEQEAANAQHEGA